MKIRKGDSKYFKVKKNLKIWKIGHLKVLKYKNVNV